ncbi:ribonuclease H-like domain-containing protein [Tanacetum coccineum]|uniref:Ribonuclease H-like domain-containing protein n=1 Tax=Tanacetum coccineum TaxID=301880 RepID=A0ABQ4ZBE8_9ASTR
MESQSENTQTVSALKLPILKTGGYDLWSMKMEQYLTHTDYDLWEVIMNGDAPAIALVSTEGPISPKTTKQKLARKNELKAKSTLLLAIPNDHLLKFHGIKDVKTLWEPIKARNNIALIMRNKADLDELSLDDLYNNLKMILAVLMKKLILLIMFLLLDNEDLEKIDTDDLEEMDLKWQVAMLTMRVKRFLKKIGRNLNFNGKETVGFDKINVECYNCHRRGYFAREYMAPRNHGNRNGDAPRRIIPVKTHANTLVIQDGIYGYDWSYQAEEGPTEFALMAHLSSGSSSTSSSNTEVRDNSITELKNQLAEALREKYDLKLKLEKFKTSTMKLTKLINSQISVNNKSGVGFDSQMNENELHDCHLNKSEEFESASDSSVNEIEDENNQVNDRFKKVEGYHAVPPPYTRNYMPSRPNLSFAGLDDSVYKTNVSKTISSVPIIESTASKSSKDSLEQLKDVRPSAPIIKEWESDSDDDCVIRPLFEQNKPSYAKINFVKSDENTRKSIIEQHTYRQAENLRKSQSHRDCNFYENKMAGKSMLNNMGRVTGQREVRQVWNNAQRVNHQNKLTHPHPKRNIVPTTVATKSGLVQVNAAKQSSPRASTSISTARHVNTAALKPKVNAASPTKYYYFKVNNVTTARPKVVVSIAEGKRENAVKSSACWIWRPTEKVIDHISKDSGSYMPKRFDYVDPQGKLKHMTGNKSYLTDYQDINGGFVAFAGSPKGGKITGKGKIRTEKLDFEDVYFVKELKFNLLSVSQMCDKKNSVLFTETECLILSPNFKLLDESQFCGMKGIKREFNVARTPQQNGVAERKNKTLIEAARTMLADSLLPTTFWAEAVNTACYVQNRVLVTKPHNKTPYELLLGQAGQEKASDHEYILLPLMLSNSPLSSSSQSTDNKDADEAELDNSLVQQKEGYANNTNTEISQSSGPIHLVADETVYRMERQNRKGSTTASSLKQAGQCEHKIGPNPWQHLMNLFLRELIQVVVPGAKIPYWGCRSSN